MNHPLVPRQVATISTPTRPAEPKKAKRPKLRHQSDEEEDEEGAEDAEVEVPAGDREGKAWCSDTSENAEEEEEDDECTAAAAAAMAATAAPASSRALDVVARAKAGVPLMCEIAICGVSSDTVKWFAIRQTLDGPVPVGKWCWTCGTALESWPLTTKDEVALMVSTRPDSRKSFALVRQGVEAATDSFSRKFPRHSVSRTTDIGVRVLFTVAFVTVDTLAAHFKQAVEGLHISVVQLKSPEHTTLSGVLFKFDNAFAELELPHYTVELYSDEVLSFERQVLHPSQILRAGQAADTFAYHGQQAFGKRPTELRTSRLPSALRIVDYKDKVDKKQEELKAKEAQASQQNAATDAATGNGLVPEGIIALGEIQSASRLLEDDEEAALQPGTGSGRKAKKSRVSGGAMVAAASAVGDFTIARRRAGQSARSAASDIVSLVAGSVATLVASSDVGSRKRRSPDEKDIVDVKAILKGFQAGRELTPDPQ